MSVVSARMAGHGLRCCLNELVREQAERNAAGIAVLAPGRRPLTYGRLRHHVQDVAAALHAHGIGRNDRVAMVLPDGPEMAVAFIAVAAVATCAPLNPAYRSGEFDFHLADLRARALLVASGAESPVVAVARARGIAVLELAAVAEAEAGIFTLAGERSPAPIAPRFAQPDDVALVLHTSGTEARPKCVPLTHANLWASARNIVAALELSEDDRCLNVMPLFHIHGLSTILASLAAGASLACPSGFSAEQFFAWLEAFRPTWYTAAPTIHHAILEKTARFPEIAKRSSLRLIRSASAAMPRQLMAEMERVFGVPFLEAYGMTEAGPQIASNRLPPRERKTGSVGQGAGPDIAIMDEAGAILTPGETGEVVIRGPNVMQAYENDPAANQSAFTRGWFRTGDEGHLDSDGYLFITGRIKEIINRGGEKISPHRVEEVLMDHPAVAQAVAFAVPHPVLGENIAAGVVLKSCVLEFQQTSAGANHPEYLVQEIRDFAATRLAHFQVPQQVAIIDEIPTGPSGKLRRNDLAEKLHLLNPHGQQTSATTVRAAPRTPVEKRLAEIWAGVLGIDLPGIYENFFQLGGHSLAATRVVARLRAVFQVELPIESLFERPTVAGLAELVGQRMASLVALGQARLDLKPSPGSESVPIATTDLGPGVPGTFPLSFAQQRLWFLDRMEAGAAYNMSASLRLTGTLNDSVLARSLDEIRRRHGTLRTTFHLEGDETVQVIAPPGQTSLPVVDLTALPSPERESELRRLAAEEANRPFDLARGPLFRATLVRLGAGEHVLLLSLHHIISDGWSTGVLFRELEILYESFLSGRASPLPELAVQYSDFTLWQREWLREGVLDRQLAYWKEQLRDLPPVIGLPTDRPRPQVLAYRGSTRQVCINRPLTDRLTSLSVRQDVTLFMTLLAAFKTLLFRYSGQDDCAVGVPIANRTRVETESLIGLFANTLVLRTSLSGDPPFQELLDRVRTTALGAFAHQDLPFETLVGELQPERDPSRMPLLQVMFAFQNLPDLEFSQQPGAGTPGSASRSPANHVENSTTHPPLKLAPDLVARPFRSDNGTAKFDLTLYLSENAQGIVATWQYNADLFEAATIERMSGHFQTLLDDIVVNSDRRLSELKILSDGEQREIVVEWNRTEVPFRLEGSFHHQFELKVERDPNAIAVECGDERLTYGELNNKANQLARHLQGVGVAPETLVGICLTRSVQAVVALLGVMKAGGAFLSIDPEYPAERIAFMLEDSRVPVLVTEKRLLPILDSAYASFDRERPDNAHSGLALPRRICLDADAVSIARQDRRNPESSAAPENLAYVIYTSGSTGRPKGVMITHANLCHYVQAMKVALGIVAADRYLHTASFAFSSSVRQFTVPLACGAAVVIAASDQVRDPEALFRLIRRYSVSVLDIVPSYWQSCIDFLRFMECTAGGALLETNLRLIVSASEPLPRDVPEEWASCFGRGVRLINMYGQTETTGIVTTHPIPDSGVAGTEIVSLGRPIANTRIYILDDCRRPVPVGVCGEMYVGGAGVGRGYLNRQELTADRFVPDPFATISGARLYRTGDLARYQSDGTIEFIGRADRQIKVRGFRVEPGEVEAVLREHYWVRECAVAAHAEASGRGTGGAANGAPPASRDGQRLVAFVVPADEAHRGPVASPGEFSMELRGFLKQKLPEYMVPSAIVELEALPRTPNGKVDRNALSTHVVSGSRPFDSGMSRRGPKQTFTAPRTTAELSLANIWQEVLQVDRVGIEDNFFDLGGDSLLCIQVVNRANRAGLQLKLSQLFQYQTIAELARVAVVSTEGNSITVPARRSAPEPFDSRSGNGAAHGRILGTELVPPAELATSDRSESLVFVTVESLRAFGREALSRAGLAEPGAAIVTEVQLEASLRGQPTHHMDSIPRYARRIAARTINPQPQIRVEHETAVSARIDGDNGPGQWVSVVAMQTAIQKARESGVGIVSVRRSNHFGAAGHYVWGAALEGLIGLCTTNGPLILAPTGGLTPTFGNNPLGVGIPAARHFPILLDIAMSVAPRGKIGLHLAEGKPLPPGWILDRFGRSSTDPVDLAAGLGMPIGGHKGYGLALVMETLAGVLSGAGFCDDHRREQMRRHAAPADFGHFFIAIDPELFLPLAEFTERVDRMIEQTKAGERAQGVPEILIPGEAELRARERSLREGVALRPLTYRALRKYGEDVGLTSELAVGPALSPVE